MDDLLQRGLTATLNQVIGSNSVVAPYTAGASVLSIGQAFSAVYTNSAVANVAIGSAVPTVQAINSLNLPGGGLFGVTAGSAVAGALGSITGFNVKLKKSSGTVIHYSLDPKGFDKNYDYDFTKEQDSEDYSRGGHKYTRPLGSYRYAVNVLGKYSDNKWLGTHGNPQRTDSVKGEWAVAYHGTSPQNANGIVKEGFDLNKGKRFLYGKGIYCAPNPKVAKTYGTWFEDKNGQECVLIIQTRVNPKKLKVVPLSTGEDYWILPDHNHIRPYGICIYTGSEANSDD